MEIRKAYFHLPGLFEFYELYRVFLPLYRTHRDWFYDWCEIGSLYGAPADCLWGGGRTGCSRHTAREVLALAQEYGISARLTFSNSLLREEHLTDPKCNALCAQFAQGSVQNGVIVHSDLLVDYLQEHYPELYLVSSTTKVLTEFAQLEAETARPEFRYVVPDFRLNKALRSWTACRSRRRTSWNFSATSAAGSAAPTGGAATRTSAAGIWASSARSTAARPPVRRRATAFPKQCGTPALSERRTSAAPTCPWAFRSSKSRAGALAVRWCWNFCCTI